MKSFLSLLHGGLLTAWLAAGPVVVAQSGIVDSLKHVVDTTTTLHSRLKAALDVSVAYMRLNADSVRKISGDVLRQGQTSFPSLAATAADQIGMAWLQQGKPDSADYYFQLSYHLNRGNKNYKGLVQNYNSMGRLAASQRDYTKAEQYYQAGIHLADSLHDESPLYAFCANLGVLYARTARHEASIPYFHQALTYYERTGNEVVRGMLYGNLGLSFLDLGVTDSAIGYTLKSIQIKRLQGDVQGVGVAYGSLANIYETRKDWPRAIESRRNSIRLGQEVGNLVYVVEQYARLSTNYLLGGEARMALTVADSGLLLASTGGMDRHRLGLYQCAASACTDLGKPADAAKHWEQVRLLAVNLNLPEEEQAALAARDECRKAAKKRRKKGS